MDGVDKNAYTIPEKYQAKIQLTMRIPAKLYAALKAIAEKEDRPLAHIGVRAMRLYVLDNTQEEEKE